ncbi:MAG: hypothetical protein DWG83_02180 [Chloroflexi bacterium]|nr:FtsX-like permease family protein [Chloroflexota bacterium]MQC19366.1 hypothetical protein [Chloroflexota bacterium]
MDSLFGVELTSILIGLLILVGLSLSVVGWVWVRQPILFRMGIRNLGRRRAQTALIVVGLMLSTLIISAAFATGDTVGFSITNAVYDSFEEVDIGVAYDPDRAPEGAPDHLTDDFLADLRAEFAGDADVDGVTGVFVRTLPVINLEERLSQPQAVVVGVDPATVDSFRGLRTLDNEEISAQALTGNRVYISENLADEVNAGAGDRLRLFASNEPFDVEVLDVVRDTSLTTVGDPTLGGLVAHIDTVRALDGEPGELTFVVISAIGGTRDSLDAAQLLEDRVDAYLEATQAPAEVAFTKEGNVELAELLGSLFVSFFLLFGLFSIAAGVMLIFLIFVMLAAERRSEMGMARAVGMKRLHVTEMFLAEGSGYNLGAAVIGATLGIVVALGITWVLGVISEDFGFSIAFHFNPQGFVIAFSLGIVLTFATIAFSSFRAANLNIVRAIRDLPEPQPLRGADRSAGGLVRATLGALWMLGWIALVGVWIYAFVLAFIFSLGTYGLGIVGLLLVSALFVFGARSVRRGRFTAMRGWRPWLVWALWILLFNVVAALTWLLLLTRDWAARYRNAGGWAVWTLVAGLVGLWLGGWVWGQAAPYTAGVTLLVFGAAMLAVYFGGSTRGAFTVAGAVLLAYWLLPLPFSLFTDLTSTDTDPVRALARLLPILGEPKEVSGNIEMFFVSGIAITASSTLVVIFNAQVPLAGVSSAGGLLRGLAPAVKTAVAYPLAARFRTGMTLAMFALVVFSLVVMATLNFNFSQLFFSNDAKGGFDVVAEGNASNPIGELRGALAEGGFEDDGRIEGVGRERSLFLRVRENALFATEPDVELDFYPIAEVDDEFLDLAALPLAHRAAGYATDAEVIEALRTDPGVAIADDLLLGTDGFGVDEDRFALSDELADSIRDDEPFGPVLITVIDRETGNQLNLRVIAFMEAQVSGILPQLSGIFVHDAGIETLSADGRIPETFFLTAAGEPSKDDLEVLADDVESALLESGVQASSIQELIDDQASASTAFQLLFEGFMGLGLVVGIAALGVIALRTVVERRQQIGMLRALGYTRRLVALSFFMESSFIALTGIAIGLVMGTALSYNLLTDPEFTDGTDIVFRVPWFRILLISGIAYGASALMTLLPARAASRVPVAEALRYE